MSGAAVLADFPFKTTDKIRYGDTDRQGHVNNVVFAVFLETARVELLFDPAAPLAGAGTSFVLARLELDFVAEITWPGTVAIGTRVLQIGRSSLRMQQAVFQNERCVANAQTVIVLIDENTRKSTPLSAACKVALQRFT